MTLLVQNCNPTLFRPLNTSFVKSEKNKFRNNEIVSKIEENESKPTVNSDLARVLYNIKTEESNKESRCSNIIECSDEISSTFKDFLDKFGSEISDTLGEDILDELKQVSGFTENMVNAFKNIKKGKDASEKIDKAINYAKSSKDVIKAGSILATGIAGVVGSAASLPIISSITVGLAGLSTLVVISLLAYKYYNISSNSQDSQEKQHYKQLAQALEKIANQYTDKITQKLESNQDITKDEKIAALSYLKLASLVESATKNVPLTKVKNHKKFEKLATQFDMNSGNNRMLINNYLCNNIANPESIIKWVTQSQK